VLSSSKSDAKQEARFSARLDVLMERMDTLAATVATTASAMAKKDGEIAALRRDLEARDQALQALIVRAQQAAPAPASGASVDANELRSLRNAVAALTKEHAESGAGSAHVEELEASVRALGQRVDELAATTPVTPGEPDAAVTHRVDGLERDLAAVRASVESLASEPNKPSEELLAMLAALRAQVGTLGELASTGATGESLDQRFAETDDAVQKLSQRLDTLAQSVESAAASLGHKENELALLQRHFTDSSTRIESIVDDIRETLHALPEPSSTSLDELATRLERVEASTRKATESSARTAAELSGRIDVIEQRVATVAEEVSRAKTLWPVALRSLEARLDDAVHSQRPESDATLQSADPADDLLAGLRDSLQAMETVAAEMARASDTLGTAGDAEPAGDEIKADEPSADEPAAEASEHVGEPQAAAAGGATIVPLRSGEP
jgi:DNA repair exonuclease SbcCD ATPase subunit